MGAVEIWCWAYRREYIRGISCPYCLSLSVKVLHGGARVCNTCGASWRLKNLAEIVDEMEVSWAVDRLEGLPRDAAWKLHSMKRNTNTGSTE